MHGACSCAQSLSMKAYRSGGCQICSELSQMEPKWCTCMGHGSGMWQNAACWPAQAGPENQSLHAARQCRTCTTEDCHNAALPAPRQLPTETPPRGVSGYWTPTYTPSPPRILYSHTTAAAPADLEEAHMPPGQGLQITELERLRQRAPLSSWPAEWQALHAVCLQRAQRCESGKAQLGQYVCHSLAQCQAQLSCSCKAVPRPQLESSSRSQSDNV